MRRYVPEAATSGPTAAAMHCTYTMLLDFVYVDGTDVNARAYHAWHVTAPIDAVADGHGRVAHVFALKPGTPLPDIVAPVAGVGPVTDATLSGFIRTYVEQCTSRPDEIRNLHAFILRGMTTAAKSALANNLLWNTHKLGSAQPDKVHHLLKCVQIVFASDSSLPEERQNVTIMRGLLNGQMGDDDTVDEYLDAVVNRKSAAFTECGYDPNEYELVVIALDGLNSRFDLHRKEIIKSTTLPGARYPPSLPQLKMHLARLDSACARPTDEGSAFAARVAPKMGKPRQVDEKDRTKEQQEHFNAGFKKASSKKDTRVTELEKEIATAKARIGELEAEAKTREKTTSDADDKTSGAKQRVLKAGSRGIHVMPQKRTQFGTLDANHADMHESDTDDD